MMQMSLTLAQEGTPPANDTAVSATSPTGDTTAITAADGSQTLPPPGAKAADNPFGGIMMLLPIMLGVMIFMTFRSQSKEKKKRAQLISSLAKGDKVQTIGGIIGNVVEIRDTEVVIKIDENTNTKMKFARSAIQNKIEE